MEVSSEGSRLAAFVGEGLLLLILGGAEFDKGLTEFGSIAGDTSVLAKSGSVMHGTLCKGVEDSRCSLLACMMPSLPKAVMGIVDKDDTE